MKQAVRESRRKRPSQPSQGGGGRPAEGAGFLVKNRSVLSVLLIAVVGIICYINTFSVPFVLDDETSILYNPTIRDWTNLRGIWQFSPNRFITYWTLAANYHFGQLHLAGYHALNLAIHVLTSILAFVLVQLLVRTSALRREGVEPRRDRSANSESYGFVVALFAALLFVSHPIQTQAVTYIIQRTASLVALFYLLSMTLYVRFRLAERHRYLWFVGSLAAAVAAMLTKQNALTLPVAIVLLEFFFFSPSLRLMKRAIPWLVVFLLTLPITPAVMLATQNLNVGEIGELGQETRSISRTDYLFSQFNVVRTYLRLLVLPIRQNLDYDYPVSRSLADPKTFLSLLLLLGVVAAAIWLFRRNRLASFGIFFFFLALAVESSIIPIKDVIFEHRVYLPAFGFFLAFVSLVFGLRPPGLDSVRDNRAFRSFCIPRAMFLAVVVVVFSGATIHRNMAWRSTLSIWTDTAAKSPNKARPHLNLGSACQERGRVDLAYAQYQRALELRPNFAEALANLAGILTGQGQVDKAVEYCEAALQINPKFAVAHSNLGVALSVKGEFGRANDHFLKATQYRPFYKIALYNWGYSLLLQKKPREAIERFQEVLSIDPAYAEAHLDLGNALMQLGRREEAAQEFQKALRLKPGWAEAEEALKQAGNS